MEAYYLKTCCLILALGVSSTFPRCRDDQYWFSITGKCEPCSRICDPPSVHENDCPYYCGNYTRTTTTTTTTTTHTPSLVHDEAGRETPFNYLLAVSLTIAVAIVLSLLTICNCCIYKKRESLKQNFPLKQILRKAGFKTTTSAVQAVQDDLVVVVVTDNERSAEESLLPQGEGMEPEHGNGDVNLR